MKSLLRFFSKQTHTASLLSAFAFSIALIHFGDVQAKSSVVITATKPLAGAKIVLTKVNGNSSAQATLSTTSDSSGKFTFPSITIDQRGSGMTTYTLTVTPATTYNVTYSSTGIPKMTPNNTPVQVFVTFNQLKGLTANGGIANTGPLGPIGFMSNSSLQTGVAFGGVISGSVSK